MKRLPASIKLYLFTLEGKQQADGYLCLNANNNIVESEGWVGVVNLSTINREQELTQSLTILEGLLPGNPAKPTIINNAHVDKDNYFDIHLFNDQVGAWVLFIDKTRDGRLMQEKQQIRLTDDYKNAKRRIK